MRLCDYQPFADACTREGVRKSWHDRWRLDTDAHWYCHKHWYAEYLRSHEWKKLRARILRQRGKRCELCGTGQYATVGCVRTSMPSVLQVHHLTYERVGEELDDDLVVLCRDCHKQLHELPSEPHLRSLKAIRLATNLDVYRSLVMGQGVQVSLLDKHWVARYGV